MYKQLKFETLLADLRARFVNLPADQIDREIEDTLRKICECLGIDHSALWHSSPDAPRTFVLAHLYRNPKLPPAPERMDGDTYFPWSQQKLIGKQIVSLRRISDAPPEAATDRKHWELYGMKSLLAFPLWVGDGPIFGVLSFDATKEEREWPEGLVNRLQILAQVFANALARKRSKQALQESEARLRLAAASAGAGLWTLDTATGRFWATDTAKELFGFGPTEEFDVRKLLDSVHPEDREAVGSFIKKAIQSGEDNTIEHRIIRRDGEVRWISARGRRRSVQVGEPDQLMGVLIDVTERRQTELVRQRHSAIVPSSDDAIISMNLQGIIADWNAGAWIKPSRRCSGNTRLSRSGFARRSKRMSCVPRSNDAGHAANRFQMCPVTDAMKIGLALHRKTRHKAAAGISVVMYLLVVCGWCIFRGTPTIAQEQQPAAHPGTTSGQLSTPPPAKPTDQSVQSATSDHSKTKPKDKKEKRGAIVVAPLPISSPAIGSGIVPVLAYIFPFSTKDKISPPSVVGGAGLITNNGSRGFAVGAQLYLKENRYRITGGYAHGNVDYNIYGTGMDSNLKLPLAQTGHAYFGEFLRRIGWQFFVGPRFLVGDSVLTLKPNAVTGVPIPPDIGLHTALTAIGAAVTRDTSSNRFYPTGGTFFNFTADFFSQGLGSKYSFQSYRTTFDYYGSLSKKQVLAYNAFFCATGGAPPFYGNCIYGTNNELRGYTAGRYFTRYMLATQLEYRLELPKRFGLVVFGGLGGVIPSGDQLLMASKFLPGGGGGLRFQLSKKYHVNLRADIAQGTDGHTFSMGVGEAF